jgi:hypothetical protein
LFFTVPFEAAKNEKQDRPGNRLSTPSVLRLYRHFIKNHTGAVDDLHDPETIRARTPCPGRRIDFQKRPEPSNGYGCIFYTVACGLAIDESNKSRTAKP